MKSIRAGLANIGQAFAKVEKGEMWLYDADIQPYAKASHEQHEPKRRRKLLLHRKEIAKLENKTQIEGHSIIALRMYWKDANVKVEIGIGKGKNAPDKRQDIKAREVKRESARVMSDFNKKRG